MMFCPNGYVIFSDIDEQIISLTKRRFPFSPSFDTPEAQLNVLKVLDDRGKDYDNILDTFFAHCPSLSVVSPRGTVLRVDWQIGHREEPKVGELPWPPWLFIDPQTWTVSTQKYFFRAAAAERLLNVVWPGYSSNAPAPRDIDEQSLELVSITRFDQIANIFRAFDGWAITCKANDSPILADWLQARIDLTNEEILDSRNTSLAEIAREIVVLSDQMPGLTKNIARSRFSKFVSARQFDMAWVRAAETRPALSRPGRKPTNN